ncbi:PQQ-dependent sugar dehydrogenase [Bacillus testis]|uniref:PQQ-dependent sugar dehydrogenase n=1 Tax=Bacillus testis TaxID=1622072 RepID=UPI00067F47BF|nr:PQQ-dependent sugar dehydrogenase [Bacillus testis]
MRLWIVFLSVFLVLLAACQEKPSEEGSGPLKKDVPTTRLAADLHTPWSITKEGDTFYISERSGSVAEIKDGVVTRKQLELKEKLSTQPESGFLGFELFPDFRQSQKAYGYYTYDRDGISANRVVVLQKQQEKWQEQETLLDRIPSGQFHHGGRLKLGPDGCLYITTGDALQEERAQDRGSLNGKILRVDLAGGIPAGNPFPHSSIYSYGHRNPQGLAWDGQGNLYSSEHGSAAHDEINIIQAGKNYGWPLISGSEQSPGLQRPIIHSGEETWAPAGVAYHQGFLYIASLRGESVKQYEIRTGKWKDAVKGKGRIRDVYIEGNTLYFITNNTDGRGTPAPGDDGLFSLDIQ